MNSKWGQEKVFSTIFVEISKKYPFLFALFFINNNKHLWSIPLLVKSYTMIMQ